MVVCRSFRRWLGIVVCNHAKQQSQKPAGLSEIEAPIAEEGVEIPVLFGTRDLNGPNVVWYGDLKTVAIKSKGGKK